MKHITHSFIIILLFGFGLSLFGIIDKKVAGLAEKQKTLLEREAGFAARLEAALLENPAIILDALRKLDDQAKQDDLKADAVLIAANMDALHNDGVSWVSGNPEGDITLVEFIDYKCGYCRKAHSEVAALIKSDGNIRLIIKEYPILGEASLYAARLAIATLKTLGPAAYGEIHNVLMTYGGPVNTQTAAAILAQAGLDAAAVLPALQSKDVEDQIARISGLGRRLKITGTPAFIFNDQIIRGYIPLASMQSIVGKLRNPPRKNGDKS